MAPSLSQPNRCLAAAPWPCIVQASAMTVPPPPPPAPPLCFSHALVQATVGVGIVIMVYVI